MRIVILAAGVGSRLGNPFPKPLTRLADGATIMGRQIELLNAVFRDPIITVVVGFKKDMIMEAFPDAVFVYNQDFGETNTSKSLLKAMQLTGDEPVLWLNGDVVFAPSLLRVVADAVSAGGSFVSVNTESVGDEEVKYLTDAEGSIIALSKSVVAGLGEAVGINFVSREHKGDLINALRRCDDQDYFERAIELSIADGATKFTTVDVSAHMCIEVDFIEDLERANDAVGR